MAYKYFYFDVRGRGEAIRLLMEDQGIKYDEVDAPMDENWLTQWKPNYAFGKLPCLKDGDLEIVESMAILRHLARKHELYGANLAEMARADMLCDAWQELFLKAVGSVYSQHDQKYKPFLDDLPKWLSNFEKQLEKSGGEFFVGTKILFVDYFAFHALDTIKAMSSASLDAYPKLLGFYQAMANRPNIKSFRDRPEIKKRAYTGSGNL